MDEKRQPQPDLNAPLKSLNKVIAKEYSPEIRQKIRFEWESGTTTKKVLGEKYGIKEGTIKCWASKENWNRDITKGKIAERIQEKIHENIVDRLFRLGLPEDEFIKMIVEGAKETKMLKNIKQPIVGPDGQVVMSKKGRPVVADKTISVTDNDNTRKYRELLVRVIGLFAAPKTALPPEADPTKKLIPMVSHIPKIEKPTNEPPIN